VIEEVVNLPVLINYIHDGKRYEKVPDSYDLDIIDKISECRIDKAVPCLRLPFMHETHQRRRWDLIGATHEHHLYTKKTLLCYSELFYEADKLDDKYRNRFKFLLTSCFNRTTKLVRYMAQHKEKNVGPLSGTLYTTSIFGEINVFQVLRSRLSKMKSAYIEDRVQDLVTDNVLISTQSTTEIDLPQNSIDYIFIDPPFGDNLMYSELNRFTEMWFRVYENIKDEAIINKAQNKSLDEYQHLMKKSFERMYFALKPGRWITVEFHNSQNSVWNIIQRLISKVLDS
jgi:16S rRNA G966 N2-methylase RsmD